MIHILTQSRAGALQLHTTIDGCSVTRVLQGGLILTSTNTEICCKLLTRGVAALDVEGYLPWPGGERGAAVHLDLPRCCLQSSNSP